MSTAAPEFSRPVALAQLGGEPFRRRIEASAPEREKLARRFDLIALDRLEAEVVLRRQDPETVLLEAEFSADFEQSCTVTLEPVRGAVSDRFSLIYGPPPEHETELAFDDNEPVYEPITGDTIDVGEAVAQELSLALPLFPRDPAATIEEAAVAPPLDGPFAELARLKADTEC
jgi:uncharacterized metal-binding protein YceD (DUF177 family)